jgi:putative aldouronate transport system permease protein
MTKQMKTNAKPSDRLSQTVMHIILVLASLSAILPLVLCTVVSFTDEKSIMTKGYSFFPEKLSLDAYRMILGENWVFNAYAVTIFSTVAGTLLTVLLSAMIGYALSCQKMKYRNTIALILFIPMIFSAGLVPWYLLMTRTLGLKNSIFALIVPNVINPFWIFLLRNYFKTIPPSLAESAEMDGANPLFVFIRIITPLSTPILATIVLFSALAYWNNYTNALWLIDRKELYPLQYMLYKVQSLIAYNASRRAKGSAGSGTIPSQGAQMATFVVTLGPIVLVYPFVQKYFVKGIMIGAVKG